MTTSTKRPDGGELKPCRKCGGTDVSWWDGRGTQAHLYCNDCGQEEGVQVIDLFEGEAKDRPLLDAAFCYPADLVTKAKAHLVAEWNTRTPTNESPAPQADEVVARITYTNWRGETSVRRIIPKSVRYGSTEWHPEPQWLLLAWDDDKKADREFALKDFGAPQHPVEGLREALRWALPLAETALNAVRLERIRCGHQDIRGKNKTGEIIGLHQSEIDAAEFARAALASPSLTAGENTKSDGDGDPLVDLVDRFSAALLAKLQAAREKYGYDEGWRESGWKADCQKHLIAHLAKGDPRDVAAYCAFMWHHGWRTIAPTAPDVRTALDWKITKGGAYVAGGYLVAERVDGKGWNTTIGERVLANHASLEVAKAVAESDAILALSQQPVVVADREAIIKELQSAKEAFGEIGLDWSDPRDNCREGSAAINRAIALLHPHPAKGER
jgi:hypothetical protein